MAGRKLPPKYTKTGRLSAAYTRAKERRANARRKVILKEAAIAKAKAKEKPYRQAAKALAKFVPSLKGTAQKEILTKSDKRKINKFAKILKHAPPLKPLTKKQAKKMKGQLFAPGVRAVGMRGMSSNAKITSVGKDAYLSSNGRQWVLLRVDRPSRKRNMREGANRAFNMQFPIERIGELAHIAFTKFKPIEVRLWTHHGIVGDAFESIETFLSWLNEKWNAGRYMRPIEDGGSSNDIDAWVNGIAVLIHE